MSTKTLLAALAAVMVAGPGGARADTLQPEHHVNLNTAAAQRASWLNTEATLAMMGGKLDRAAELYSEAIGANPDYPWPYYGRGEVLIEQGKIDQGVLALAQAERRFARDDLWGRSVALYARGRALSMEGRCRAAKGAFDAYAALVTKKNPEAISEGHDVVATCNAMHPHHG